MPKVTIDGMDFNLNKKEYNIFEDIPWGPRNPANGTYVDAMQRVRDYMRSMDHKPGETVEDTFDILINQERENNIEELIKTTDEKIDKQYADRVKDLQEKAEKQKVEYYEKKAKALQESKLKGLLSEFKHTWGDKTPEELSQEVAENVEGNFTKNKNFSMQNTLSRVASGLSVVADKDIEKDPQFYKKVDENSPKAKAILEYNEAKRQLETMEYGRGYLERDIFEDPENIYKKTIENDPLTKEIGELKERANQYVKENVDEMIDVEAPFRDAKQVYLQQRQNDKQQFKNILAQRNELVDRYQKTNIFSRIARWVLPNSWSDAGKLQNKIDEIDKAVKEAGYDNNDVKNVQEELKEESMRLNPDAVDTSPSDVTLEDETLELRDSIGKDTTEINVETAQQIKENTKVQEKQQQLQ